MQWYYVDLDGTQHGPILTPLLMHKIKEGDIDGLTLIYGGDCLEWKKLSSIPVLNDVMTKIAAEEENKRLAFIQSQNEVETKQQQKFLDSDSYDNNNNNINPYPTDIANYSNDNAVSSGIAGSSSTSNKKSFIADNGISYVWDDVENDWIEADDDDDVDDNNDDHDDMSGMKAKTGTDDSKAHLQKRKHNADDDDGDDDDQCVGKETTDTDNHSKEKEKEKEKKKRRNKKKHKKLPSTWVYITGLPPDVSVEELKDHFSKVGLIALSPYDQQPKIKVYREDMHILNHDDDDDNVNSAAATASSSSAGADSLPCKGDCSICYNAEESVQLAIDILNGGYIRVGYQVTVSRASFAVQAVSANSNGNNNTNGLISNSSSGDVISVMNKKKDRPILSQAQVKVAKSAIKQALTWNEDDDIGVSKSSALRIIVLQGLFRPQDFNENSNFSDELEEDIAMECSKCGNIEKITVFSSNPRGVVIVKFSTSFAAQECIKLMNGRYFGGKKILCFFWDGVTNYSVVVKSDQQEDEEEKQEEHRLDEFGDWLEQNQEELPEEFMLRTE